MIVEALKSNRGIMAKAARQLGLTERTMGLRVRKHAIDAERFRAGAAGPCIIDLFLRFGHFEQSLSGRVTEMKAYRSHGIDGHSISRGMALDLFDRILCLRLT